MKTTIGLSLIMKNEARVITRALNSVYPILDHYTIVDTGSTDDSKQIVKDFFDSKNISGEIYDHPFANFEDARNFALNKAKDKTDFCFTLDADNVLNITPEFNLETLHAELSSADIGMVKINFGEIMFGRYAFWRNSKPFKYVGAVHEYLMCEEPASIKDISNLSITPISDGASWGMKDKFLWHAQILIEYIAKNGLEPRHVFYLAESYKDAGEPAKAIEWYQKRLGITTGFYEELYWAQLMIAGLKWGLNYSVEEVADEYMKCGELDELRAEHLYFLKIMYEKNNRPQSAKKIGELLTTYKNPYPSRMLFLNPKAYPNALI